MEQLHATRFLALVLSLKPDVRMSYWAELYRELDWDPSILPCGCPNQDLDRDRPLWEHQVMDILRRLQGEDPDSE